MFAYPDLAPPTTIISDNHRLPRTVRVDFQPVRMTRKGQLYRTMMAGTVLVAEAYSPMTTSIEELRRQGTRSARVEFFGPGRKSPNMVLEID